MAARKSRVKKENTGSKYFVADIVVDPEVERTLELHKRLPNGEPFRITGIHSGEGNMPFLEAWLGEFKDESPPKEGTKYESDYVRRIVKIMIRTCFKSWNLDIPYSVEVANEVFDEVLDSDNMRIFKYFSNPNTFSKDIPTEKQAQEKGNE